MSIWVTVKTFYNRIEADIAKGMLEENGIRAVLRADDAGGMYPQLAFSTGVQLQVEKENEETARTLLE